MNAEAETLTKPAGLIAIKFNVCMSVCQCADESEEVEQLTREVKGTIEDILGESIEQYF